jgi:hypothetical protein
MPRVIGSVEVLLFPGVKEEQFERFMSEDAPRLLAFPGLQFRLFRGDRGDRAGRYLVLMEYDSVATRDRISPTPEEYSAEYEGFPGSAEFAERYGLFVARSIYTDYVEVAA